MSTSIEEFNEWLLSPESHRLEFKEAKNQFNDKRNISDYCAALANEGGGKLILGVSNKGKVVGSRAFMGTFHKIPNQLLSKLGIRVDIEELIHPDGRVLIFYVPSHFVGQPIKSDGIYWMRAGESLTPMDAHTLRQKLNEVQPDFSAQIVRALKVEDIDDTAVNNFKVRWSQKAKREEYLTFTKEQAFRAIGVLSDK